MKPQLPFAIMAVAFTIQSANWVKAYNHLHDARDALEIEIESTQKLQEKLTHCTNQLVVPQEFEKRYNFSTHPTKDGHAPRAPSLFKGR